MACADAQKGKAPAGKKLGATEMLLEDPPVSRLAAAPALVGGAHAKAGSFFMQQSVLASALAAVSLDSKPEPSAAHKVSKKK